VKALYAAAKLSLSADLATLNKAARVAADPAAVTYLSDNIIYNGKLTVPVLTLHTVGDGLVPVEVEKAYMTVVREANDISLLHQAFVIRAGHCAFTPAETIVALETLDQRVTTGKWKNVTVPDFNNEAAALGPAYNVLDLNNTNVYTPPAFLQFVPTQFLRVYDAFTQ
jgi:hypothetical protein